MTSPISLPAQNITKPPLEIFQEESKTYGYNYAARRFLTVHDFEELEKITDMALPKEKRLFLFKVEGQERKIELITDVANTIWSGFSEEKDSKQYFHNIPTSNLKGLLSYKEWCDKKQLSSYREWIAACNFAESESLGDFSVAEAFLKSIREEACLNDIDTCEKELLEFLQNHRIGKKIASQLALSCIEEVENFKYGELQKNRWKRLGSFSNLISILAKLPQLHITSDKLQAIAAFFPNITSISCSEAALLSCDPSNTLSALEKLRSLTIQETDQKTPTKMWMTPLSRAVNNLTTLIIKGKIKGDASGSSLCEPPAILTHLEIGDCTSLDTPTLQKIAQIESLKTLKLTGNSSLTDDCFTCLRELSNLKTLTLCGFNSIGPNAMEALKNLQNLTSLDLSHSNISDFSSFQDIPIHDLYLSGTPYLTKDVLKNLLTIRNLNFLDISFCKNISPEEVSSARKEVEEKLPATKEITLAFHHLGSGSIGIDSYNQELRGQPLPENVLDNFFCLKISDPHNLESSKKLLCNHFSSIKKNENYLRYAFQDPKIASNAAESCIKHLLPFYETIKAVIETVEDFQKELSEENKNQLAHVFTRVKLLNELDRINIIYPSDHYPSTPSTVNLIRLLFPKHRLENLHAVFSNELKLNIERIEFNAYFLKWLSDDELHSVNVEFLKNLEIYDLRDQEKIKQLIKIGKRAPHLRSVKFHHELSTLKTNTDCEGIEDLSGLECLELKNLPLRSEVLKKIASIRGLKTLNLINCIAHPEELAELKALPRLKELNLSSNATIQLEHLTFLKDHPTLSELNIKDCAQLDSKCFKRFVYTILRLKKVHHTIYSQQNRFKNR